MDITDSPRTVTLMLRGPMDKWWEALSTERRRDILRELYPPQAQAEHIDWKHLPPDTQRELEKFRRRSLNRR